LRTDVDPFEKRLLKKKRHLVLMQNLSPESRFSLRNWWFLVTDSVQNEVTSLEQLIEMSPNQRRSLLRESKQIHPGAKDLLHRDPSSPSAVLHISE
jgi:hypothetical protein